MDTSNKDQFKKLTPQEKDKAIQNLVKHPEDIICKSTNDLFVVKPLATRPPNRLYIEVLKNNLPLHTGDELICQYLHNRESLYIFRCEYTKEGSTPSLILNSDFYMIQRRENYRLRFPTTLASKVLIKNRANLLIPGKVIDLSTTGTRIACIKDAEHLTIGDEVNLEIQVVGHEPINISAHLRHRSEGVEISNDKKISCVYCGFQFFNMSQENEKNLSRINMELYRNFFQKVGS
ncbi:MAG: PilZ domain-containing protein [Bdellovibrionaceae bacterium]|nr:PilZ domain-containing protein [Pseudobdellovibrionaceae bacterium]